MDLRSSSRFGIAHRLLLFAAVTLATATSALGQVVNLCPGQFTGRVRIGARDVLDGYFFADSTSPTGFHGESLLNGTYWNGVDILGPFDPDGYTFSVQSDIPGCDTNNSTLVEYNVTALNVQTSSGFGDIDYTLFPVAAGRTVAPQSTTPVEFLESSPWILDVDVTNLSCLASDMYQIYVGAISDTNGHTESKSYNSQLTTDGMGHQVRYLDIPLITGSPSAPLNTFTVESYAYFTGTLDPYIYLGTVIVGPGDVDANGHIHVHFDASSQCPACTDANLVGNFTLNGISPSDAFYFNRISFSAGSSLYDFFGMNYDLGGGLPPGRYNPSGNSYFTPEGLLTSLTWPLSAARDYDGIDSSPYEDLACQETGDFNFLADAAFIEGNISFSCRAAYGERLVSGHTVYAYSFYEGQNPDDSFIGSYGGQGGDVLNRSTGHYRLILTPGAWNVGDHVSSFDVIPPGGDPEYPEFVHQVTQIIDNRSYSSNGVNDPRVIHLAAGQNFTQNLDYEMGKLTVRYTITANTPAERELHDPRLVYIDPGTFNDPNSSINPLYYVYSTGYGSGEVTQAGSVTMYLPKGFYRFRPSVYRQIDGSFVSYPEFDVTIGGCVTITCDVSCPEVQWMPLPDTCGGAIGSVSGTASDPDGWDHIGYRVNFPTPGPSDLTGYTNFALVPTGGANNEVTFTAPLVLSVGANSVELEAVDAAGNRNYEGRTIYRTDGSPPTLDWTFPPDGYVTGQSTVPVQGSVSAGVKIDFVKINGVNASLAPIPSSPNPNDRTFDETYVLHAGQNVITIRACDVCGQCVEETRTVTRTTNQPPICDADGSYFVTVAGGHGSIGLDGTGSSDPDGDTLLYSWSTDCPDGTFDDRFIATPVLSVGAPPTCSCMVHLIVTDPSGASAECSSAVTLVCDDGVDCNGAETCDSVQGCVSGPPPDCTLDLTVTDVDVSQVTTDCETLAANGTVSATVKNLGGISTGGGFTVLFFEDSNGNGTFDSGIDLVLGSAPSPPLAAGASAVVSAAISATVSFSGNLIYAFADSANVVAETNEANNVNHSGSECSFHPRIGAFHPVLEWSWTSSSVLPTSLNVMNTPAVIDLDGDGVPEVVFGSTRLTGGDLTEAGNLRALNGATGAEVFTVTDSNYDVNTAASVAVGDIDLDGRPEIIACRYNGNQLMAFEHDGAPKWTSLPLDTINWGAPAIADLDGDGIPEIIMGRQVLSNGGAILWTGTGGSGSNIVNLGPISLVADLSLDGLPEVVAGNTAYDGVTGSIVWTAPIPDGLDAIGNFDADPYPEIVHVSGGLVRLLNHDGTIIWGPVAIPGSGSGGPPTIADFDGDGLPEIGVAGERRYAVFEHTGALKWSSVIVDGSSQTGSSVFDFEGDGSAEVLYRDELNLRVYRGSDGTVLFETGMSSCTWHEYVLVADVDADGNAELVAVANQNCGYGPQQGVFVFGDANDQWVNTRKIWNQHSYHITNVNDNGTIPSHEQNSWAFPPPSPFNSYRTQALEGPGTFAAPDLTASFIRLDTGGCPDSVQITARIGNGGANVATAPVSVAVYDGDPNAGGTLLGVVYTSHNLHPGEFEDVTLVVSPSPQGPHKVCVFADRNAAGSGSVAECNEGNNECCTDFSAFCATRCVDDADCDDGLYCNGIETCDPAIGCVPGAPQACDDGIPCTLDSCNEQTASCDHMPIDALCDDGDPCTVDSCDRASGCQHPARNLCDRTTVVVDQNVTVDFNPATPICSGDPDLCAHFTFDKSGSTPDTWKAIFDVGPSALVVKNGATITTATVPLTSNNRTAPGIEIRSICSVEAEAGGAIVVGSVNQAAGDIVIVVEGPVTVNGTVSNEVSGTNGRPGNITIRSSCGGVQTGPQSRIETTGQDFGGSDIDLSACEGGDVSIRGLVDASYRAERASVVKVHASAGSVTIDGNNLLGIEEGTQRRVTSGVTVRSRRDPLAGQITIQARDDVTVLGNRILVTNPAQQNYGAVAIKPGGTNGTSGDGAMKVLSLEGRIVSSDRAFDFANRFNRLNDITLWAKGDINLSVTGSFNAGASNNRKAVVSTEGGDTGRGGVNMLRSYGGRILIGTNAQVLADFTGRPGSNGTNLLTSCLGLANSGIVTPADAEGADDSGVCTPTGPQTLLSCADQWCVTWYGDEDGDGYGSTSELRTVCDGSWPPGFVIDDVDCNDSNPAINPAAVEVCDGIDNNCDWTLDNAAPPVGIPSLLLGKLSGTVAELTWSGVSSSTSYDVVTGDLLVLRSSGGDFTNAVQGCSANDLDGNTMQDPGAPPPGDCLWYLVSPVNCGGAGTYNSGGPMQQGDRDAEIRASSNACP